MAKKPKKKRPLNPRQRRYAIARGRGMTMAAAAKAAGYAGRRARKSATGTDLEKDPRIVQLIKDEITKSMTADEVQNLLGAQARGEIPTKVVKDGKTVRVEHDVHAAAESVARIHQLFKDGAPPPPPPERVEHAVAGMTDEELAKIVRGAGVALGLVTADE